MCRLFVFHRASWGPSAYHDNYIETRGKYYGLLVQKKKKKILIENAKIHLNLEVLPQ